MPENDNTPQRRFNIATAIALAIVVFSFTIMIIMIIKAFGKISDPSATVFGNIKDIIGLFLPVIGTWMGTILAYYFSRENFESANRSMQQTISKLTSEEKLKSTKAASVMIPLSGIEHPFKGDKTSENITIKELLDFLNEKTRNRIVVMDSNHVVSKVIHRSVINSFISDQVLNNKQTPDVVEQLKIKDMEESKKPDVKNVLQNGVEFIPQDATLFDAQQKMMANKDCQDVFITTTGKNTEGVIGWITNSIVTDNANV